MLQQLSTCWLLPAFCCPCSLDNDGFPAAVQHQQEELQGVPSASDLGGTELLLLSNLMSGEQLLPEQVCGTWPDLLNCCQQSTRNVIGVIRTACA